MNTAKKALARTKVFVTDHKVAVAVVTTATVVTVGMVKLNRMALKDMTEFLIAKNLLDEFFNTVD